MVKSAPIGGALFRVRFEQRSRLGEPSTAVVLAERGLQLRALRAGEAPVRCRVVGENSERHRFHRPVIAALCRQRQIGVVGGLQVAHGIATPGETEVDRGFDHAARKHERGAIDLGLVARIVSGNQPPSLRRMEMSIRTSDGEAFDLGLLVGRCDRAIEVQNDAAGLDFHRGDLRRQPTDLAVETVLSRQRPSRDAFADRHLLLGVIPRASLVVAAGETDLRISCASRISIPASSIFSQ